MEVGLAITEACKEMLPMFGIQPVFLEEISENSLNSASEVNILIGLTQGLRGSIIIGFSKPAALKMVSGMMGGMEVSEMDEMSKSALGELTNMLMGNSLAKLQVETIIAPTIVLGRKMFLMISRVPSKKLNFQFDAFDFNISYCIE